MYAPEGASSNDCYVYFDVSGDKSQNTQPVYPFETITEGSNSFFGFKCYITSVQMADEIHAVLKYGGKTVKHTYTAKEYLDDLIADTTQPEDAVELGKAIKDYGCYVQPVLADTSVVYYVRQMEESEIKSMSYALVLDSDTAIEIYLVPKEDYAGDVVAYVDDGTENMAVKKNGEYVVTIGNIPAHKLRGLHSVEVVTGESGFSFGITPMSYVRVAIQDDDPAMKRAVTSLYRYMKATNIYRSNRRDEYKD